MSLQPRPEHPRPQFYRPRWINLNGPWQFALDLGCSGAERGWATDPAALDREIIVPFCPESVLSGIGHTDFIPSVWYARTVTIPDDWAGQRVLLHFGGVDYDCRVWVNGQAVGRHVGGSSSFTFDITAALREGENSLVVHALDDVRAPHQASGKQSTKFHSHACVYTRVTGIWQTVWLEAVPQTWLERVRVVPSFDAGQLGGGGSGRFLVTPTIRHGFRGLRFRATARVGDEVVSQLEGPAQSGASYALMLSDLRPWSPADPFLYDLQFELLVDGAAIDTVESYAGLRTFHAEGHRLYLNGEPIFLRLVLDQGFYPDGIWTAPTDDALRRDIELAQAAGFHGARLHQKVFEERFHYWADRLGYLTWGEYADWGGARSFGSAQGRHNYQTEWREIVMRDLNHPSIIVWTPYNETNLGAQTHREEHRQAVRETVALTRALDPTRPVNDSSGYVHVETDLYTVHLYEQDPEKFRERFAALAPDQTTGFHYNFPDLDVPYSGQPYLVDEYGGTWWNAAKAAAAQQSDGKRQQSWGYGKTPESVEEVYHRIEALTKVLCDHPFISGFCYTQLTDVEQEQNGVYAYDRSEKFDMERLRAAFQQPAAIEREEE